MTDDASLLSQFVTTGSDAAFAALVERHMSLVYYSALRQLDGDAHRARDVAQEVFILLARKAPALRRHPTLAGWLHATTHYEVSALRRTERRRREREQAAELMQDYVMPAATRADWEQLAPVLDRALLELPERDREALLLRFFQERAFADISARLSLNEAAAQKRVQRALERLRTALVKRGVTSAAALTAVLSSQVGMAAPSAVTVAVTAAALKSAAAALPAASLLSLMSTAKISAGIAAAAIVIALGTAGYEVAANRRSEAALAADTRVQDGLVNRVRGLSEQARAAQHALLALQQKRAERGSGPPGAAVLAELGRRAEAAQAALAAGRAFLQAHPEVSDALVARSRARAVARYGALFGSLGLNPAQIARFQDIIMQGEGFGGSQGGTALQFQIGPAHASDPEIQAQLQAFLGDPGYAQYRQYVQMMPAHEMTTQMASALYFSDTPLTAGQAAQLTQAYADTMAAGMNGTQSKDSLLRKAQGLLVPAQLAALNDIFQQKQFNTELSRALKQQTGAGGDPAKTAP